MTAMPLRHPAQPPALALGVPLYKRVPCGCEDGMVTAYEPGTATFYAEGREVWVRCPDCSGAGSHDLYIVANTPALSELYPAYRLRGGFMCVRVTDEKAHVGWARTLEDAEAWRVRDSWETGWMGAGDEALLDALGIHGGVR